MDRNKVDIEQYKYYLRQLKELPDVKSGKLERVAGIIADYVKEKHQIELIVVGGLSVEIYTEGGYTTQDIDFVGVDHEKIMEALEDLGFVRLGKDSMHEELKVYVEIPGSRLKDADEEYITRITTKDNFSLSIIGKEDIIKDRLRSYIHWKQLRDREWAYDLIKRHIHELDTKYIERTLTDNEREIFREIVQLAKEVDKEESRQLELVFYMEKHSIPHSYLNENVIVLTLKENYIGFSLTPVISSYVMDESDDEDTLILFKEKMTIEELVEWLQSIDFYRMDDLIKGIRQVYETLL